MATAFHNEALRKKRILDRKREAECRMAARQQGIFECDNSAAKSSIALAEPTKFTDPRPAEIHKLERFRVNEEGFRNRYRNRAQFAPHADQIFHVIYPDSTNPDYTVDENRKNRRLNRQVDKYEAEKVLNGELHILACDDPL